MSADPGKFENYQIARKRREAALEAYRKAESEFIAADRAYNDAKRAWFSGMFVDQSPYALKTR